MRHVVADPLRAALVFGADPGISSARTLEETHPEGCAPACKSPAASNSSASGDSAGSRVLWSRLHWRAASRYARARAQSRTQVFVGPGRRDHEARRRETSSTGDAGLGNVCGLDVTL